MVNELTNPKDQIADTLAERGDRYGDFSGHARIAQDLQDVARHAQPRPMDGSVLPNGAGWNRLSPVQRQALTVIFDKIARILNGDPNYDDNWIDIQGYAKLAQDRLGPLRPGPSSLAEAGPATRPAKSPPDAVATNVVL